MLINRLDFGINGNAKRGCLHGFHQPEHGFTWSSDVHCAVNLHSPSHEECLLIVRAKPYVCPPFLCAARIKIRFNDIVVADIQAIQDFVVSVPVPFCPKGLVATISFQADDATSPSRYGKSDSRVLGVALETIAIVDVASAIKDLTVPLGDLPSPIDREIARWAACEMIPWAALKLGRERLERRLVDVNEAGWSLLCRIEDGQLAVVKKPCETAIVPTIKERSRAYLEFFSEVAREMPDLPRLEFCICPADQLHGLFDIPIMTFQKSLFSTSVNIPDVDFLQNNFYEGFDFRDILPYNEKLKIAVFNGSTTGGVITDETAADLSLPRLRAAAFFEKSPLVHFSLPKVVQCASGSVEKKLKEYPFCGGELVAWRQQFRYRFLISIDGNGAACSRVAIALRSNSALLKYESIWSLFYFRGLQKSIHYVPIRNDEDVIRVVAMEVENPTLFGAIASAGHTFAHEYLTKEKLKLYVNFILRIYALLY